MTEKPLKRERLAEWENEGGQIDSDPRDSEVAAGDPAPPAPLPERHRRAERSESQSEVDAMKTKTIIAAVSLLIGFVLGELGGVWLERRSSAERTVTAVREETARAESLAAEVAELQHRETLLQLHLRLGRIAVESNQQDYGTAGERAARFFDDLARLAAETAASAPEQPALRHVLAARDEIIAGLATARPEAAQTLERLYLDLFSMMQLPSLDQRDGSHPAPGRES